MTAVPWVVHQIWLQGRDGMSGEVADLHGRAAAVCQQAGWAYKLWDELDLVELLPEYREARHIPPNRAFLADLGRYALLWNYGGLYLDMDVELYRLPRDLAGAWVVQGGNHVIAAPPHHPRIWQLLEGVREPGAFGHVLCQVYKAHFCNDAGWDGVWPQDRWHDLLYGRGLWPHPARECYGHHWYRDKQWGSLEPLPGR